ncbi:hypothetical protein M231_03526 [Tremella mesenterica]|uniref:GH16 domain-containing protein n=1 Tax=Tremella mesenterica TaxID=5217 RepID=A0A4Q1BMU3_TREME|nr:uncharacterized protein TREMEDRAFT_27734 [Tremella mesenterica DSM 1558]EIW71075.1 hypothetical protein TREMEDRAFT_27734 [Tremella mesenterica DSM 1558]RXK39169.1 hypothetical protein M231_03526 [Tremella mesenterica]
MWRANILWVLGVPALVRAATYPLIESWSGNGFMNGFKYPVETYDNTTNGDVFWATAANTSLIYVTSAGTVVLKVDNTTVVPYNEKRYTPKLLSKTQYAAGTVFVMDLIHMPYGCSVWPALWTQGNDWPKGGEIDIMEGINQQTTNQIALHTNTSTCTQSSSTSFSGTAGWNDCSIETNNDSGCIVNDTRTDSYGAAFAQAGGGVFIAEFSDDAISVWFLTRSDVPSNLSVSSNSIDTSTLGEAAAIYSSSTCSISNNFSPQTLTIDITLCGAWAGLASVLEQTCPPLSGTATCYTTYVINQDPGTTYANAYFEFNYINIFSSSGNSSISASKSGSGATSTITAGAGTSSSGSTSGTGRLTWSGLGMFLTGVMGYVLVR